MNKKFTGRISEAYSHHSQAYLSILEPTLAPMAEEIAGLAVLSKGQIVLDLATGTGLIARTLAQFTESVIGADISPGILKLAHHRSQAEIPFIAADAHQLPFRDECFDLVTCGVSLSHFSDVSTALREIHRVLRPGMRFITSAWANEGENPSKTAAVEVRRQFLTDREIAFEGMFNEDLWADVEGASETLRRSGFADIQTTTLPLSGEYKNHEEAVEAALAWPITRYRIAQLSPEGQKKLREETALAIRQVEDLRWRTEVHYYVATRAAIAPSDIFHGDNPTGG